MQLAIAVLATAILGTKRTITLDNYGLIFEICNAVKWLEDHGVKIQRVNGWFIVDWTEGSGEINERGRTHFTLSPRGSNGATLLYSYGRWVVFHDGDSPLCEDPSPGYTKWEKCFRISEETAKELCIGSVPHPEMARKGVEFGEDWFCNKAYSIFGRDKGQWAVTLYDTDWYVIARYPA